MKTLSEIKLEWQKHNRDNGLSWNEVAMLVNEVAELYSAGDNNKCHSCGEPMSNDCPRGSHSKRLVYRKERAVAISITGNKKNGIVMEKKFEEVYVRSEEETELHLVEYYGWRKGSMPVPGEFIGYLKKLTRPVVTEGEMERAYIANSSPSNTGMVKVMSMSFTEFKAAIKELLNR